MGGAPGKQIDHDEFLKAPVIGKLHATPDGWIIVSMVSNAWIQSNNDTDTAADIKASGQAITISTTTTEAGSS